MMHAALGVVLVLAAVRCHLGGVDRDDLDAVELQLVDDAGADASHVDVDGRGVEALAQHLGAGGDFHRVFLALDLDVFDAAAGAQREHCPVGAEAGDVERTRNEAADVALAPDQSRQRPD